VAELAAAQGRCVAVWRDARPRGDYSAYTPPLRHLLGLVRERAAALADDGDLYDALLADYEPGARAADIGPLLEKLTARVAPLIDSLRDASAGRAPLPGRRWPEEGQRRVSEEILRRVGFDTRTGALAVTAHPMTSMLHRGDVRLSTRFADDGPLESILSTMHEAGHGLYEQGLPADADRTLVFEAPSLGAHESQSRFWENHVGRTAEWWASLEPVLREHLPGAMDGLGADDLHRAATRVGPSVIRTQSDEVTYDLHIVLRFRLERAMVLGDLGVDDLPSAFADGLEELVGVRPATLAEGAMQDIHWAAGLYGYFPTYSLGNLNAAQLAAALERDVGSIGEIVAGGDLSPLLGFMRDRVHRHGHLMDATRLMRTATGGPLEVEPFARHLERTYGTL
jgi:carboxypeptidase Taq